MKARTRTATTTLALLVLVVGALTWVRFGVEKPAEREEARKAAEAKVFSFDAAEVVEIRIFPPAARGGPVTLVREGDGWRIAAPIQAPADRWAADSIAHALAKLTRKAEVAPAGADPAALRGYGLENPRSRVEVALAGGKTAALALGDENAFDGSLFVNAAGGPVLAVGGDLKWTLDKGLFDLREKRLVTVDEQRIASLEVEGRAGRYALEREAEGDGWRLAAPEAVPADRAAATKVLYAVRGLRATRFADPAAEGKRDRDYGLEKPRLLVRVKGRDGHVTTLRVGEPPAAKGAAADTLWVRVGDGAELAAVEPSAITDLEVPPGSLKAAQPPPETPPGAEKAAAAPPPQGG